MSYEYDHQPAAEKQCEAIVQPHNIRSAWQTLRQAVAGTDEDLTQAPIGRAVFLLAVPMVLEMLMESVFALCDVFYVSRLGVAAVAAVGLTEAMITPLYAVAGGLAMATTAMVARRIGEKQPREAAVAAVQAIWVGVAVAAVVAPTGAIFAKRLLILMGAEPDVVAGGASYTMVMLGGSVTIVQLFLFNAVFRGAGDASLAMRSLWLANGINIVLDPCLIFGLGPFPELGLVGAAIATTIGRGVGVCYQVRLLVGRRSRIAISRDQVGLATKVLLRLLRVSFGGIMQFLIATSSWIGLMRIVGNFGSAAVAGYTVAIRIIVVTILPAWGIANAAATLMGQNLGAGRPDRAESSVWRAGLFNLVFMGGVAVLFIACAELLIGCFTDDPAAIAYGVSCLRWVAYGYGLFAYGMVVTQAFNGAGDTTTPTIINFFCYWMFQIPLAWLLATRLAFGARGVFIAITVAESVLAIVAIGVFRRGRWRTSTI